ncbi:uncharacterized protein YALI1_D20637g [Yarrowia lipolytica]|uniref:Uncharacterized protein n=1 Tax=Yarrowia lipolytica TaxID=4952 RepID=A0A1D8NEW1_YARLL|nr:hypothetical protein YALI1_D20637g [Yarrowia lipolytica]
MREHAKIHVPRADDTLHWCLIFAGICYCKIFRTTAHTIPLIYARAQQFPPKRRTFSTVTTSPNASQDPNAPTTVDPNTTRHLTYSTVWGTSDSPYSRAMDSLVAPPYPDCVHHRLIVHC